MFKAQLGCFYFDSALYRRVAQTYQAPKWTVQHIIKVRGLTPRKYSKDKDTCRIYYSVCRFNTFWVKCTNSVLELRRTSTWREDIITSIYLADSDDNSLSVYPILSLSSLPPIEREREFSFLFQAAVSGVSSATSTYPRNAAFPSSSLICQTY